MTAKKPENTSNILIVDDNKFIREVLTKILQRTGYYVTSIETGEEMLEKLKSNAYNVAIIDVRLKDTNGIDILGKIQKNTTNMKKIILTGYPSDEDKKRALEQGLGIMLSTLHQSSLGSLFLIMPHRLHPLWYTPILPLLFFVSAVGLGLVP